MSYMFGLTEIYDLGTQWQGCAEYGYAYANGDDGFSVDLAHYMTSNGLFKIRFPAYLLEKDAKFFSITVKDYNK